MYKVVDVVRSGCAAQVCSECMWFPGGTSGLFARKALPPQQPLPRAGLQFQDFAKITAARTETEERRIDESEINERLTASTVQSSLCKDTIISSTVARVNRNATVSRLARSSNSETRRRSPDTHNFARPAVGEPHLRMLK